MDDGPGGFYLCRFGFARRREVRLSQTWGAQQLESRRCGWEGFGVMSLRFEQTQSIAVRASPLLFEWAGYAGDTLEIVGGTGQV